MNPYTYQMSALSFTHGFLGGAFAAVVIAVLILELLVKGYALWNAARNRQTIWFVVLLIVHTLGILDVVYLLWFRKDENASASVSTSSAA